MTPPFRYLGVANTLTYVSLGSALLASLAALETRDPSLAGLLITLACLADSFDGAFAGRFPRTSDQRAFGRQLDSLADAIVFGLAVVTIGYRLIDFPTHAHRLIWTLAAIGYLACVVTRLGCFNLHQEGRDHFVGLPTTLAGLFWSAHWLAPPSAVASTVLLISLSIAMVVPVKIARLGGTGRVILLVCLLGLLMLHLLSLRFPGPGWPRANSGTGDEGRVVSTRDPGGDPPSVQRNSRMLARLRWQPAIGRENSLPAGGGGLISGPLPGANVAQW